MQHVRFFAAKGCVQAARACTSRVGGQPLRLAVGCAFFCLEQPQRIPPSIGVHDVGGTPRLDVQHNFARVLLGAFWWLQNTGTRAFLWAGGRFAPARDRQTAIPPSKRRLRNVVINCSTCNARCLVITAIVAIVAIDITTITITITIFARAVGCKKSRQPRNPGCACICWGYYWRFEVCGLGRVWTCCAARRVQVGKRNNNGAANRSSAT